MSNLQIGLAIAGGVVLAAVVAHGAWTSRKNSPRQALPELHPDTQPQGGREPGLTDDDLDTVPYALPVVAKRPVMDSLIDVIATIALDTGNSAVSGEAALTALPTTRRAGSKPFAIEGYNLATLIWEPALAGQRYGGFQAGVQMANRSGALNEIEYSEFVVKTQAFAASWTTLPARTMRNWDSPSARYTRRGVRATFSNARRGSGLSPVCSRGDWCCLPR